MITHRCQHCGKEHNEENDDPLTRFHLYYCADCLTQFCGEWYQVACPPLQRETDPKRLNPEAIKLIAEAYKMGKGVLLSGKSRAGKTRTMWATIQDWNLKLALRQGKFNPPYVFDSTSFGHEMAKQYREDQGEDWIEKVSQAALVAFDDLGKEKLTDRAEAELFALVDRRMNWKRPIIATTEHSGVGLAERFDPSRGRGQALLNRLVECCDVIVL